MTGLLQGTPRAEISGRDGASRERILGFGVRKSPSSLMFGGMDMSQDIDAYDGVYFLCIMGRPCNDMSQGVGLLDNGSYDTKTSFCT
jgi:hypothetical protein